MPLGLMSGRLEPLQARDLLALLRHHALEFGHFAKQPDHHSLQLGRRQAIDFNHSNHVQVESQPATSRESKNHSPHGVLPRLPYARQTQPSGGADIVGNSDYQVSERPSSQRRVRR
jgi:hypothetical protein